MKREIKELEGKYYAVQQENHELYQKLGNIRERTLRTLTPLFGSRAYRLAYLQLRLNQQGIKGSKEERRKFWKWVRDKIQRKVKYVEYDYNPLRQVESIINECQLPNSCEYEKRKLLPNGVLTEEQKKIISAPYMKSDIIIFGVIDYDFRFQRPQHFAERFARDGHRVFYVNANFFRESSARRIKDNLYIIDLHYDKEASIYTEDFLEDQQYIEKQACMFLNQFCIRDASIILDYPNWINVALYIREHYGFKFVTDYMDDFTGFLNTTSNQLKLNCIKMLKESDWIIPSSKFLFDIAVKYNSNCSIVRNGTEFDHFNSSLEIGKKSEKSIIGYYGAIAHWFDLQKVCYLAERFPNCELMIVGEVTEGRGELEKHSNITLYGEKPYNELPNYLSQFDVCLIPFDTSTDLIKATNPVKFYEYLSVGKKIVATEIPELMPYRDKYVYMSNDDQIFGDYVEKCLLGTDTLASAEESIAFAKENDWKSRYETYKESILKTIPLVSIVVITYNNIEYNIACLRSVFQYTAYENYEIVVVDNNSTDGTREWLSGYKEKKIANLHIILNNQNVGFAGGNNIGIDEAKGKYIILLNNDTLVSRGWITGMVKHLENDSKLGMIGAVTNSIGNEAMIPTKYTSKQEMLQFSYLYTQEKMGQTYNNVNMLAMFCTVIPRKVIDSCGKLDEQFGIGMFEDDDYSMSVISKGYSIAIAEDSFVHHFQSISFGKIQNEQYMSMHGHNRQLFEKKWGLVWNVQDPRPGYRRDINSDTYIDVEQDNKSNDFEMFVEKEEVRREILRNYPKLSNGVFLDYITSEKYQIERTTKRNKNLQESMMEVLSGEYKGIMVYPFVIDWEPFQTPQQLLITFAEEGWLCFFCESREGARRFEELRRGVWGVPEDIFLNTIGDRQVYVLLTWMGSVPFVDQIRNKKIWYHILDHLNIFSYYDSSYEEMHNYMTVKAEWVTYVAEPLKNCILSRRESVYVPNACHADKLINTIPGEIPDDMKKILEKGNKVVGYFGWIAEWMDYVTIEEIAKIRTDLEFVFIGKVMDWNVRVKRSVSYLSKFSNIHFLGVKEYDELPSYAYRFNIATIPFEINNSMDCVSPIKFFEYCAYGLPTITSYMPEMSKYCCNYVGCYNSKQEYLQLLDRFLTDENVEKEAKELAKRIALENTWKSRVNGMESLFKITNSR